MIPTPAGRSTSVREHRWRFGFSPREISASTISVCIAKVLPHAGRERERSSRHGLSPRDSCQGGPGGRHERRCGDGRCCVWIVVEEQPACGAGAGPSRFDELPGRHDAPYDRPEQRRRFLLTGATVLPVSLAEFRRVDRHVAPPVSGPDTAVRPAWGAWSTTWLLSAVAVWLTVLGAIGLLRVHLLWHALRGAQGQMVGPVLVAVVAVMFLAERYCAAERRPARARAHLVDALYLVIYAASAPAVILLDTGFVVAVDRYARFLVLDKLPPFSQVLVSGLILVGIDAMNWAAHVGNHRVRTLWRFHALHHSQEQMSVLTTFRTHPFTHVSYLPALLPVVVLEASGTVPSLALVVYGCLVAVSHSNVSWTYGRVGGLVVSPAYHRLHHAKSGPDGARAVNFGFVLALWDRIAGTAAMPSSSSPVTTGLAGRPVPVEQDRDAWASCLAVVKTQLAQPFRMRSGLED